MRRPSIVLLIAGVILGYVGFKELRFARLAQGDARTITCAELASNGPGSGDASVVRLTDFWLGRAYIYRNAPGNSTWTEAYVPAFPGERDGAVLDSRQFTGDVRVILKTTHARSQEQLYRLEGQPVTGVIVNELESFSDDEKAVLRGTYPNIDFARCWIVEVNPQPATTGRIVSMVGGGGALAVLGVAMFFMGNRGATNLLPRKQHR
jgi:hypothetical protein